MSDDEADFKCNGKEVVVCVSAYTQKCSITRNITVCDFLFCSFCGLDRDV